MHKSKGQKASAASARTNRNRKRNENKNHEHDPAVRRKWFPPAPRTSTRLPDIFERPVPVVQSYPMDAAPLGMALMVAGAASAASGIERLDILMDAFAAPGGPEVLEITVGEDLSNLRPKLEALKKKTAFRRDSFLELVEELNRKNPV